jgi:two-component system nitrate/nitrite sensor histidine kinase NarX
MALADISQSPRLSRAVVREQRLHAFAAVPLAVSGRSLGVLGVFSHLEGGFSPEAVTVVTAIGQQIALALENIALLGQVEEQARSVAALQERERLAGEIHDGVAQNLSYLYVQLDRLADETGHAGARAELARLQSVLEATTDEVRQLIARLQDGPPVTAALADGLRDEVQGLGAELGVVASLTVAPNAEVELPATAAAEVRRIVGEAMRNAARHGHAGRVRVELGQRNGRPWLRVSDDGAGFDPALAPGDGRRHFGLKVMQARAQRIGAELSVRSSPGAGASVELVWAAAPQTVEVGHE